MKFKVPNLPAGFECDTYEAFSIAKFRVKAVYNSKLIDYIETPLSIRESFQVELIKDKKAFNFFTSQNLQGVEIEEAFVSCRYGNYDSIPDFAQGILKPDCPNCGIEHECTGFNIGCKLPDLPGGKISGRELQIIKLVARGLFDKEISDRLGTSVETVRNQLQSIRKKMEVESRLEVANWAFKHNL